MRAHRDAGQEGNLGAEEAADEAGLRPGVVRLVPETILQYRAEVNKRGKSAARLAQYRDARTVGKFFDRRSEPGRPARADSTHDLKRGPCATVPLLRPCDPGGVELDRTKRIHGEGVELDRTGRIHVLLDRAGRIHGEDVELASPFGRDAGWAVAHTTRGACAACGGLACVAGGETTTLQRGDTAFVDAAATVVLRGAARATVVVLAFGDAPWAELSVQDKWARFLDGPGTASRRLAASLGS